MAGRHRRLPTRRPPPPFRLLLAPLFAERYSADHSPAFISTRPPALAREKSRRMECSGREMSVNAKSREFS